MGRFWRLDGGLIPVSAEEFASFVKDDYAKAAWNLAVTPGKAGGSLLSTEIRVQCLGEVARRRFLFYWRLIAPWSGLLRISLLRGIRREAERKTG